MEAEILLIFRSFSNQEGFFIEKDSSTAVGPIINSSTKRSLSMTHPTYTQIANNWTLWREYVDTNAVMTVEEFEVMSLADRLALHTETFGPEPEHS